MLISSGVTLGSISYRNFARDNIVRQLGAVYMIPECLSFRNEFRSRTKFVLHSHDNIEWLTLRPRARGCRARYVPLAQDYTRLRFSTRNFPVFSLHHDDTRMTSRTRKRISFGVKTVTTHFGMTFTGSCGQTQPANI